MKRNRRTVNYLYTHNLELCTLERENSVSPDSTMPLQYILIFFQHLSFNNLKKLFLALKSNLKAPSVWWILEIDIVIDIIGSHSEIYSGHVLHWPLVMVPYFYERNKQNRKNWLVYQKSKMGLWGSCYCWNV